ncbi:MAG: hemoglobin-like flavoprotein [Pseudophaeobacter arcticus]|jgi:hemoglobin-like flavoprotein|uniref:globin domain-containing protein n=2 Tax=Pseudophaeobacter arcticus TaxID=385492 RepID=UPI000424C075
MEADTCKAHVLRSLESDRMNLDTFIPVFYQSFFAACPEARAIFPTDIARLEAKMLASLTHMAEALESTDRLDGILAALGNKHHRMEISDTHFNHFISSFTNTLATILGPEWSKETDEAWTQFLRFVAMRMSFFAASEPAVATR